MNNSEKTYTFYDFETTGLNHCFDQVIQAAFYTTDAHFNVIDQQVFHVQLRPDVIPALGALLTHKVLPEALSEGMTEYEAFLHIHEIVNRPNAYNIGYNSLNFDDLFLRFGFYRNGLEPYTHQWKNNCQRLDLLSINVLYYLFDPNNPIAYPLKPDGTPIFKLDALIEANALAEGMAHDAGVDVEATIELARRLHQSNPQLWEYCLGYFNKKIDASWSYARTTNPKDGQQEGGNLLVDFKLGYRTGYQTPIYIQSVSTNEVHYLRLDSKELNKLTTKNLVSKAKTLVKTKKNGEPGFILPLSSWQSDYTNADQQDLIAQNQAFVAENNILIDQLFAQYQPKVYPVIEDLDVDAALYQEGFWTPDERIFFKGFRMQDTAAQKLEFMNDYQDQTSRSVALAQRILFRNFTKDVLALRHQAAYDQFIRATIQPGVEAVPIDYRQKKKLIATTFLAEVNTVLVSGKWNKQPLSPEEMALVEAWKNHVLSQLNLPSARQVT